LLKGEIVVSWREFFEESEVVAPRREFIEENALRVSNLDV